MGVVVLLSKSTYHSDRFVDVMLKKILMVKLSLRNTPFNKRNLDFFTIDAILPYCASIHYDFPEPTAGMWHFNLHVDGHFLWDVC